MAAVDLNLVLTFGFWAALVAALGQFLLQCMEPGFLLEGYARWLDRLSRSRRPWIRWLASPLGACGYCMTAWLAIGTFPLTGLPVGLLPYFVAVSCGLLVWLLDRR